ncbi:hypothetical protein [Embleya hyalina]|uniref:Uncharacterized protein n=1 Tax=Embleya hyalina TaxID=516124 RepID=A0A401Z5P3_9ACTN|nr:hypothetical protein [Embleya hyalina]GCE02171.1 hypothetical protein EHYA_09948 [Embleya hyalina]
MTSPHHPPADRDLRAHAARRAEVLALLDDADGLDDADAFVDTIVPVEIAAAGARRSGASRRGLLARHRVPLIAAASVAAVVAGVAVALPDSDARPHRGSTAASPSPAASTSMLPELSRNLLPVPADRAMSEPLARKFVADCVRTVPNPEGRPQTELAEKFRPYLAVRTPRSGRPDEYFAIAVDDRARFVGCGGEADPTSVPSPEGDPRDTTWIDGPVDYGGGGGNSLAGNWTTSAWGRYTGAVSRITMDVGRGEQDALMAGGVWYVSASSRRPNEPVNNDDRLRAYDASGALLWDFVPGKARSADDCVRTPDGRTLSASPHDANAPTEPPKCRQAMRWTPGDPQGR